MELLRLPEYFLFTQYSLNTFDTCPLRFKRRYVDNLRWKDTVDEDEKKRLEMGNHFHLLARRYFMGIDCGLEEEADEYDTLNSWLRALKKDFKLQPGVRYLPEYRLRMMDKTLRLEANFDLIIVDEKGIQIWDWKTHGGKTLNIRGRAAKKFENSLQTMVYLYVLKEQSELVVGKEIECERISMHYWQPDSSGVLAEMKYSRQLHRKFEGIISQKIKTILEYDYSSFNYLNYVKHCKKCEFKWLCTNEKNKLYKKV